MKVFAVFKNGVYRHECGGIFSTSDLARTAALQLISGERDDYHDYEVLGFELDSISPQSVLEQRVGWKGEMYTAGGDVCEPDAILTVSRKGADVTETPNLK